LNIPANLKSAKHEKKKSHDELFHVYDTLIDALLNERLVMDSSVMAAFPLTARVAVFCAFNITSPAICISGERFPSLSEGSFRAPKKEAVIRDSPLA